MKHPASEAEREERLNALQLARGFENVGQTGKALIYYDHALSTAGRVAINDALRARIDRLMKMREEK